MTGGLFPYSFIFYYNPSGFAYSEPTSLYTREAFLFIATAYFFQSIACFLLTAIGFIEPRV